MEIKTYAVENLHREWLSTEPPLLSETPPVYLFGSKGFTKMAVFQMLTGTHNHQIDYWMAIPPKRQENETYEDYKIRLKFQKALFKYREHIYDFEPKPTENASTTDNDPIQDYPDKYGERPENQEVI